MSRASWSRLPLRFDVLEEVSKRLPGFPIVLHGSSSVPQEYVKMINEHGGKMPNAIGVPEDQLREAAKLSVCKINIDSDLRLGHDRHHPCSSSMSTPTSLTRVNTSSPPVPTSRSSSATSSSTCSAAPARHKR